jgi:hypothetical protein
MSGATTRAKRDPIDWWTEHLAELWERIKDHATDCACWDCWHWRATTEPNTTPEGR